MTDGTLFERLLQGSTVLEDEDVEIVYRHKTRTISFEVGDKPTLFEELPERAQRICSSDHRFHPTKKHSLSGTKKVEAVYFFLLKLLKILPV